MDIRSQKLRVRFPSSTPEGLLNYQQTARGAQSGISCNLYGVFSEVTRHGGYLRCLNTTPRRTPKSLNLLDFTLLT